MYKRPAFFVLVVPHLEPTSDHRGLLQCTYRVLCNYCTQYGARLHSTRYTVWLHGTRLPPAVAPAASTLELPHSRYATIALLPRHLQTKVSCLLPSFLATSGPGTPYPMSDKVRDVHQHLPSCGRPPISRSARGGRGSAVRGGPKGKPTRRSPGPVIPVFADQQRPLPTNKLPYASSVPSSHLLASFFTSSNFLDPRLPPVEHPFVPNISDGRRSPRPTPHVPVLWINAQLKVAPCSHSPCLMAPG